MNYRAYVTRVLSLTINDLDINKGFIRSGKVKGKQGLFHLSQGKLGKLVIVRGKIAFSFCRSGKEFHFSSSKKYLDFLV